MNAATRTDEMHVGRLTGFRCNHCGACIYINLAGLHWCPGCGAEPSDAKKNLFQLDDLVFLPIPEKMEEQNA